jgi:hypothetical protein
MLSAIRPVDRPGKTLILIMYFTNFKYQALLKDIIMTFPSGIGRNTIMATGVVICNQQDQYEKLTPTEGNIL